MRFQEPIVNLLERVRGVMTDIAEQLLDRTRRGCNSARAGLA